MTYNKLLKRSIKPNQPPINWWRGLCVIINVPCQLKYFLEFAMFSLRFIWLWGLIEGRTSDDVVVDEREIEGCNMERVRNDGDEGGSVDDLVVGSLLKDSSVGLDGSTSHVGSHIKGSVGSVLLQARVLWVRCCCNTKSTTIEGHLQAVKSMRHGGR